MNADYHSASDAAARPPKPRTGLRRFIRSRDGATAIEFALLAIPYFVILFAVLETFIAFTAEQMVTNAVDTLARKMRTGQITAANTTSQQFRQAFCNEISIIIACSSTEVATPSKLFLDVQTFSSFSAIPTTIPRISSAPYADLDTTALKYTPGGKSTINMVRAYYRWEVITDIVRPFLSSVHPADGSMPSIYLMVATAAFQNENYP